MCPLVQSNTIQCNNLQCVCCCNRLYHLVKCCVYAIPPVYAHQMDQIIEIILWFSHSFWHVQWTWIFLQQSGYQRLRPLCKPVSSCLLAVTAMCCVQANTELLQVQSLWGSVWGGRFQCTMRQKRRQTASKTTKFNKMSLFSWTSVFQDVIIHSSVPPSIHDRSGTLFLHTRTHSNNSWSIGTMSWTLSEPSIATCQY